MRCGDLCTDVQEGGTRQVARLWLQTTRSLSSPRASRDESIPECDDCLLADFALSLWYSLDSLISHDIVSHGSDHTLVRRRSRARRSTRPRPLAPRSQFRTRRYTDEHDLRGPLG